MPRVNRIRVSNIKLDGGTKVIGDKIWEQNGLSTIFLLENGGGKTSIIQLLHQVILPNHAIQGRALKSIVEKGSTINVAVEWIPDSENQPMFVTGFCFFHHGIKKENSTSTYDYFNYILERDTEDSLSLEKIPFILAGKITPYSELQSFLKQDENTQVFAQNYTYQEALEQYGILASEWQNISKVNGAEAGVTAFFDKADKIQTLIEKLLLPAFLDNLFTTDEERNAIVQAFKTYKDRLLELPALERDLIDFEAVTNNADVIIDTTKRYSELKTALENVRIQMTRLFYSLQYEKENNVDLLNELEKQLQDIEILKEELQWKIDSYKVHLYKIEEMEASARFKEAEIKKKQVTDLVKSLEQKVNEQSAAESYEDYKRYSGELNRLEAQIKTAELDADEKMQELKISLDRVSSGNRFLLSKLTEQENVSNQNIAGLTHEKDNNEHALRETQNLMTDVKVEIGKLENSITQHDQEITEISDALGDFKHKTIQESEEAVTSHILNLQAIMQKNKDALEEFDLQSKQVQGEIQQEIKNEENLKRELEETEQHFEEFSEEEHELKNDIAANSPLAVRTELFDQQEEIRSALRRKKEALNQEILQEAVMLEQYNQYYKQIDQKGYHLHPEIESVKRYLQARDIYVISGTEWLLKSTFPKEKKQEIFMKNPLLPFSLLIEKDKLKKTSALLGAFKEELTVPVFFLMKQGLEDEDVQGNFTEITNNTHLFQKFKVRFTEVEWNNWANELEEKIRGLQEKQQELKSKEQKTIELELNLNAFYKSYSPNERQKLSNQIEEIKEKEYLVRGKISGLKKTLQEFDVKEEETQRQSDEVHAEISKADNLKNQLVSFIKRYKDISLKREMFSGLSEKLSDLVYTFEEQGQIGVQLVEQLEKQKSVKVTLAGKVKGLEQDVQECGLMDNVKEQETSEEQYESDKSFLKELKKNSSFETTQVDMLRINLNNYIDLKKKAEKGIIVRKFSLDYFEKGNIIFQQYLLDQYSQQLEEVRHKYKGIEKVYSNLEKKLITTQALYEGEKERIEENYATVPYEYSTNHLFEKESIDLELTSLNKNVSMIYVKLSKFRSLAEQYSHALNELNSYEEFFVPINEENKLLPEDQWSKEQPIKNVHQVREDFNDGREKLRRQEGAVKEKINAMHQEIVETGNMNLLSMSKDFSNVLESAKGDYEAMILNFHSVLAAIEKFKESLEMQRKQSEEGRNEIIEMMYDRSELLYKNMRELPRYSQIEEKGIIIPLFTLHWPKHGILESQHNLRMFVDEILEELVEQQENGATQDMLDHMFQERVTDVAILNCYADINKCVLKALKPRNAQVSGKKEYFRWDEIAQWSNGEKHASRMAMFITLNTFIRKKRFAQENSWKFLIADNPFGEASADHVVKPMIELAKKTKTQLFCLTGIEDKRIQMEFDTVISNRYIEQRGKLFLYSESETKETGEIESMFYSKQ